MSRRVTVSVSIVTVSFESAAVLPAFLDSALAVSPHAEIVVVDNGSTDGSSAVAANHPGVKVVNAPGNLGFGRACNLGAMHATGDLLIFANPDVRLVSCDEPDRPVTKSFGLRAGYLLDADVLNGDLGPARPGLYREPSPLRSLFNEVAPRLKPSRLPQLALPPPRKPGYVSGALFATTTAEFRSLGGFDHRFFLYHEDRDLGRRYRRNRLPITAAPWIRGRHLHGRSSSSNTAIFAQTWSSISAIEYDGIWRGQRSACRTAERILRSLELAIGPLDAMRHASRTAARKVEELDAIKRNVLTFESLLPDGVDGFYPHASVAIAAYRR
jgi:GT2 family glycosyltransferase